MKNLSFLMKLLVSIGKVVAMTALTLHAVAAPLDALIEAKPSQRYGEGFLELGADAMNSTLDIFKVRNQMGITDNTGNYQGFTLRGGHAFGRGGWVDGAYMRRNITVALDQYPVTSWQVGAQQILMESADSALAIRATVWGNQSDSVTKSKFSLTAMGSVIELDRVVARKPKDQQQQLDLIQSWYGQQWSGSVFGGVGSGQVKIPGVDIDVTYPITASFTYPSDIANSLQLIPGFKEHLETLNYRLQTQRIGLNVNYVTGPWMYRAGYVMSNTRRPSVDSALESLGKISYQRNQTLVGEVAYKFTQTAHVYTRAQVMQRQFLSEIPFLYNSITSSIFGVKYGVVSAGIGFSF
jgi:hypothetical protein